jgi:ABC-type transport system involved in multi-copper enzyme maturation permease subunit
MDLRRLFRGKSLYILIGVLTTIVVSIVLMSPVDASIVGMLGGASGGGAEAEFLGASMGVGAVYGLVGLIAMLLICGDYSSGFAKNIFASHTNKWNYLISKILTLVVASTIMMVVLVLEMFIISLLIGHSVAVDDPLGLVYFLFQKILVSLAFASIYSFINVLTRNKAVGCVAAFLVGTGGLVMGLSLFFGIIGIDGSLITESTIYGSSTLVSFKFDAVLLIRVIAASVLWTALYAFFNNMVLRTRDVV